MTGQDKTLRFRRGDGDSFSVLAYAPVGAGGDDKLITFRCAQIAYILAGDREDTSCLCLNSGVTIPVRLSQKELDRAIYSPELDSMGDDGLIDLTAVTEKPVVVANNTPPLPAIVPMFDGHGPGEMVPGQGIYVGEYKPKDRAGNSLGKVFNVFAAPEDLCVPRLFGKKTKRACLTFKKAVGHIARLKNWHGFDGTNYATDKEIYTALKDGSYNGGWIIPTRDILRGKDVDGKATMPDNLYAHKDKGALKATIGTAVSRSSDYPDWYWSSTEDRDNSSGVHNVRFSDGYEGWYRKDDGRLSCRPVRLVAAPSLG